MSSLGPEGEYIRRHCMSAPTAPGAIGRLEHYHVIRKVGEGGVGEVFLARDSRNGNQVAIKLLKPSLAESSLARAYFLQEARHMREFDHPNILPVLEVGDGNCPYFVAPYLADGSLRKELQEMLARSERFSADRITGIGLQISRALQVAHSRNIVHRDVNIGNVLRKDDGSYCVADFGLSQNLVSNSVAHASKDVCQGTYYYMAPEVARGAAGDSRADIYAVGALLYELLTGQPPYFEGMLDNEAVRNRILIGPPKRIADLDPKADQRLVAVVEGAMARELRDRYATMADVARDLERIQNGHEPLGPRGRAHGFRIPKGPQAKVAWAVLLCLFVPLLAGAIWMLGRPRLELVRSVARPQGNFMHQGDWDGDKLPEIAFFKDKTLCFVPCAPKKWIRDVQIRPVASQTNQANFSLFADVNGDGFEEALISWVDSERLLCRLAAINPSGFPCAEYTFPSSFTNHAKWGPCYTGLGALAVMDLDGDQRKELLVAVQSNFSLRPRGLCCYDAATGRSNWFFETACCPSSIQIMDVEADGKHEILLTGSPTDNRNKLADGTDDSHGSVFLLSSSGTPLWTKNLGPYMDVRCVKLPRGPHQSSSAYAFSRWTYLGAKYGYSPRGEVLALDSRAGTTNGCYSIQLPLSDCVALGGTGGTPIRLFAADSDGSVHLLDEKLNLIFKKAFAKKHLKEVYGQFCGPVTINGRPDYLAFVTAQLDAEFIMGNDPGKTQNLVFRDYQLHILDRGLRAVVSRKFAGETSSPANSNVSVYALPKSTGAHLAVVSHNIEFLRAAGWLW